jgi:hypothetical protein
MIFDKNMLKKRQPINKWYWENWLSTCKRLKLDPYLSPCTKVNSKCIKYLNVRPKTLKSLQENMGKTLEDIGTGNCYLNRTSIAQEIRANGIASSSKASAHQRKQCPD